MTPSAINWGVEFNLPKMIVSDRVAYLKEFLKLSPSSIPEDTLHIFRGAKRWLFGRLGQKVEVAISLHKGFENGCD